jgi:hypothetical protein
LKNVGATTAYGPIIGHTQPVSEDDRETSSLLLICQIIARTLREGGRRHGGMPAEIVKLPGDFEAIDSGSGAGILLQSGSVGGSRSMGAGK